jgi:hypothetical protein
VRRFHADGRGRYRDHQGASSSAEDLKSADGLRTTTQVKGRKKGKSDCGVRSSNARNGSRAAIRPTIRSVRFSPDGGSEWLLSCSDWCLELMIGWRQEFAIVVFIDRAADCCSMQS